MNEVVAIKLREARDLLTGQRDELAGDIEKINSMLESYAGEPVAKAAQPRRRGPGPSMRDAIMDHFGADDREYGTHEVASAVSERYGWSLSSLRSQLSKMGKSGELDNPRRGVYRTPRPENTSTPDATGVEGGQESIGDSSDEEGGDADGASSPVGRDDRALATHGPHGHGDDRAAIDGGSMIP